MTWINKNHLEEASKYAEFKKSNKFFRYLWHFKLSITEAAKLFLLCLGSIIHAVFPWVLNFKLLEYRIKMLKSLKAKLPEDPNLKKIKFLD